MGQSHRSTLADYGAIQLNGKWESLANEQDTLLRDNELYEIYCDVPRRLHDCRFILTLTNRNRHLLIQPSASISCRLTLFELSDDYDDVEGPTEEEEVGEVPVEEPKFRVLQEDQDTLSSRGSGFRIRFALPSSKHDCVVRLLVGCSRSFDAAREDSAAFARFRGKRSCLFSIHLMSDADHAELECEREIGGVSVVDSVLTRKPPVLSDKERISRFYSASTASQHFGITDAGRKEIRECPNSFVRAHVAREAKKGHVGIIFVFVQRLEKEYYSNPRRIYFVHSSGKGSAGARLSSIQGHDGKSLYAQNNVSIRRVSSNRFLEKFACCEGRWCSLDYRKRKISLRSVVDCVHEIASRPYHDNFPNKNCRNFASCLALEWLKGFENRSNATESDVIGWFEEVWATAGSTPNGAVVDHSKVLAGIGELAHFVAGANLIHKSVRLTLDTSEDDERSYSGFLVRLERRETADGADAKIQYLSWQARAIRPWHLPGLPWTLSKSDHTSMSSPRVHVPRDCYM